MSNESFNDNEKQCKTCALLIPRDASKCTHCDTFQDFRRFMPISNLSLSLLIAFISVCSIFLSTVTDFIQDNHVSLTLIPSSTPIDPKAPEFVAFNGGNRVLVVTQISATYTGRNGAVEIEIPYRNKDGQQTHTVPAQSGIPISLSSTKTLTPEELRKLTGLRCEFEFQYLSSASKSHVGSGKC